MSCNWSVAATSHSMSGPTQQCPHCYVGLCKRHPLQDSGAKLKGQVPANKGEIINKLYKELVEKKLIKSRLEEAALTATMAQAQATRAAEAARLAEEKANGGRRAVVDASAIIGLRPVSDSDSDNGRGSERRSRHRHERDGSRRRRSRSPREHGRHSPRRRSRSPRRHTSRRRSRSASSTSSASSVSSSSSSSKSKEPALRRHRHHRHHKRRAHHERRHDDGRARSTSPGKINERQDERREREGIVAVAEVDRGEEVGQSSRRREAVAPVEEAEVVAQRHHKTGGASLRTSENTVTTETDP